MTPRASADLNRQNFIYRHVEPAIIPAANLVVWLKADAITGLSDGDAITTWPDSSGSGHDFSASGTAKPLYKTGILNGRPVARFDGTDDEMSGGNLSAAISAAATLFVVYRLNGTQNSYDLYEDASRDIWWRWGGDGNGYWGTFRSSRVSAYPAAMPNTGSHYATLISSASTYQSWIDGTAKPAQAAAFASGTSSRLGSGQNTRLNGDIAELIIYGAALGSTDRAAVEAYLAAKYGL